MTVTEESLCRLEFVESLSGRLANATDSSLTGDPELKGVADAFRRAVRSVKGNEQSADVLAAALEGLRKDSDSPADSLYDIAVDSLKIVESYAQHASTDRFLEVDLQEFLRHTESAMQDFRMQDLCASGAGRQIAREVIDDLVANSPQGKSIGGALSEELQTVAQTTVASAHERNPVLSVVERELGRSYQHAQERFQPQTPAREQAGPSR